VKRYRIARLSILVFSGLALVSVVADGLASSAAPPTATPTRAPSRWDYRIGPKDLLDIHVSEIPDLNVERRVSEDGTIALPLLGSFSVRGFTAAEAADRLKRLLESKYVQRATVDIQVKEYRSRPISVIGAVNSPGPLAFSGRWTLLEALTAAGGLASNHGNTIYVLRRADNGLSDQLAVSVNDLMLRADPTVNIPIYSNDLINVPAEVDVTVYCLGQVASPGALTFKSSDRITLLAAISRAGGLTDRASNHIVIKNAHPVDGQAQITANYGQILAGRAPDITLSGGDIIVVKESFF